VLDPDSYVESQALARALRDAGSRGVHYPSVRRAGSRCVGVFRPKSVGLPRDAGFLQFHWDGTAVRRYFDYGGGVWVDIS
jgi:hypothetical protein